MARICSARSLSRPRSATRSRRASRRTPRGLHGSERSSLRRRSLDRDLRLDGAQSREAPRTSAREAGSRAPAPIRDRGAVTGAARGRRGCARRVPRARTGIAMAVEQRTRERLPPEIFDLPVEKMREGYYADAYFNHARATLLAGRSPSARRDAGLPEEERVARRDGRGDRDPQALLGRLGRADRPRASRR